MEEDWEQTYGSWGKIGDQYKKPVDVRKPMLKEEEDFMNSRGFFFSQFIASGSFGCVYRVTAKELVPNESGGFIDVELACKIMSLIRFATGGRSVKAAVQRLLSESDLHSDLIHPNIVKTEHVYHLKDEKSGFPKPIRLFHFLELCDGDLKTQIHSQPYRKMDENNTFIWFKQIALGLQYLHDRRIAHLDLKPPNILYKNTPEGIVYKLTDFGLSKKYRETEPMSENQALGTRKYMSPEMQVRGSQYEVKPADIYSLGLCLVESLNGAMAQMTIMALQRGVKQNQPDLSRELNDLIFRMTDRNPRNRPTITEIVTDPWIVKLS